MKKTNKIEVIKSGYIGKEESVEKLYKMFLKKEINNLLLSKRDAFEHFGKGNFEKASFKITLEKID